MTTGSPFGNNRIHRWEWRDAPLLFHFPLPKKIEKPDGIEWCHASANWRAKKIVEMAKAFIDTMSEKKPAQGCKLKAWRYFL